MKMRETSRGVDKKLHDNNNLDSLSSLRMNVDDLPRYLDILTATSVSSNTSIEQLMESFLRTGGMVSQMNIEVDEASALLGVMANRGFKAAQSGNALSSLLINVSSGAGQAGKALNEMGISLYDANGQQKDAIELLRLLADSLLEGGTEAKKYTAQQRDTWKSMIGGKMRVKELDAVLSGLTSTTKDGTIEYDALLGKIQQSDGALMDMAATMKDNLQGELERTKSAIQESMIVVFKNLEPTLREIVKRIGEAATAFGNLSPSAQKAILTLGGLAIILPPMLWMLGGAASGVGVLTKAFTSLGKFAPTALGKADTAMLATVKNAGKFSKITPLLTNPYTALGVAAVAGITIAVNQHKKLNEKMEETAQKAKQTVTGVGNYFEKDLVKSLKNAEADINGVEFFDQNTKNNLIRNMADLQAELEKGGDGVAREAGQIKDDIVKNMDQIPVEMREKVVAGFVDFAENLYKDGQVSLQTFEQWIGDLQESANIKIEIDYTELVSGKRLGMAMDDFSRNLKEKVGNSLVWGFNDIEEAAEELSGTLMRIGDMTPENIRQFSIGAAQYLSGLTDDTKYHKAIMRESMGQIYDSMEPEKMAVAMSTLVSEFKMGTDGIIFVQDEYVKLFNEGNEEQKKMIAESFNAFVKDTGAFDELLQGKYGSLLDTNAEFWADYVEATRTKGGDVNAEVQGFVDNYANTLKDNLGNPEIFSKGIENLTGFLGHLVNSGTISKEEAAKIASGINLELKKIDPEITTEIRANIGQFTDAQLEVLQAMGLLSQTEAELQIKANSERAEEVFSKTEKNADTMKKNVEKRIPEIGADNKDAMDKMKEVEDTKIKNKSFSILGSWSIPKMPNWVSNIFNGSRSIQEPQTFSVESAIQPFSNDIATYDNEAANNVKEFTNTMKTYSRPTNPTGDLLSEMKAMREELSNFSNQQIVVNSELNIDSRTVARTVAPHMRNEINTIDRRNNRLAGK